MPPCWITGPATVILAGVSLGLESAVYSALLIGAAFSYAIGLALIGLGSDLCNIERIAGSIERFGDRFINRIFTETEQAKANRPNGGEQQVAARPGRRAGGDRARGGGRGGGP